MEGGARCAGKLKVEQLNSWKALNSSASVRWELRYATGSLPNLTGREGAIEQLLIVDYADSIILTISLFRSPPFFQASPSHAFPTLNFRHD